MMEGVTVGGLSSGRGGEAPSRAARERRGGQLRVTGREMGRQTCLITMRWQAEQGAGPGERKRGKVGVEIDGGPGRPEI